MSSDLSRRTLLRSIGLGAAALAAVPLLDACGSGSNRGDVVNNPGSGAKFPTYVANTSAKYDLPQLPNNGAPAVLNYPALPLPSSVQNQVGDGSTVSMLGLSYGSAVKTDAASNQLVAAVGKAMNLTLNPRFVVDTGTSYTQALATMEAAGDIPDIIMIPANGAPSISEFILSKCADLTPYLSGDNAKQYPNLAAIQTRGWELMGRIGGKIMGVPTYRYNAPATGLFADKDKFTSAGIWKQGLSVDDFLAGLQQLTKDGHYGTGVAMSLPFGWTWHAPAAGAGYGWKLSTDGSFIHTIDTPEFVHALENMQKLFKAGVYNPDVLTIPGAQAQPKFLNGTWASWVTGMGAAPTIMAQANGFNADVVYPYGDKPGVAGGDTVFSFSVIKNGSPDRIKMLLRVLDFLAAPFGSKEFELTQYGVEGTHFTRGSDGSPSNPTDLGKTENSTNVPFKYFNMAPQPLFLPGQPDLVKRIYDTYKAQMAITVADPSLQYRFSSPTYSAKGAGIAPAVNSAIADAVSGKASISDWKSTVAQLKSANAIDQMAAEFAKAHAAG